MILCLERGNRAPGKIAQKQQVHDAELETAPPTQQGQCAQQRGEMENEFLRGGVAIEVEKRRFDTGQNNAECTSDEGGATNDWNGCRDAGSTRKGAVRRGRRRHVRSVDVSRGSPLRFREIAGLKIEQARDLSQ